MSITVADVFALKKAMAANGLESEEKRFSRSRENYELLVLMLDVLDEEPKKLVINLVKYYDVIRSYDKHIYNVLREVASRHEGRVHLFPLKCKNHFGSKSGDAIMYEFRSIASVEFPDKFLFQESPFSAKILNSGLPKYAVDDFLGTGEQFLLMSKEMSDHQENVGLTGVACVAAMRRGVNRLQEDGFHVAVSEIKERAMADYLAGAGLNLTSCYIVYDALEGPLGVDEIDKRGRNGSEALLSLKRTPNNTLPIFWSAGRDKTWPAPFKRA